MLLMFIMMMLFMLISVAFFTIMERKMLGSFHIRIGPNKVGVMGLLQPFSDAMKLMSKNMNFISKSNELMWNLSPVMIFFLFILTINFIPIKSENNFIMFNMFVIMLILGIPLFFLLFSSFFSSSKFSLISSKRCVSQMLSYEMGLMMMIFLLIPLINKTNIELMNYYMFCFKKNKFMMMLIMFMIILSESSRIPFDFIESESELISGFNIEFSSIYFSLFFIYEYGMMLFFSILISLLMSNFFMSLLLIFIFINIRASFPRFRYDQMMNYFWKIIYPLMICYFFMIK